MREPQHEDKVWLGERKGAFRIVGFGKLHGERAVALVRGADLRYYRRWRKIQGMTEDFDLDHHDFFEIIRRVPVADLVWDEKKKGWRERWRQQELGL